jgi:hypothetical protein
VNLRSVRSVEKAGRADLGCVSIQTVKAVETLLKDLLVEVRSDKFYAKIDLFRIILSFCKQNFLRF